MADGSPRVPSYAATPAVERQGGAAEPYATSVASTGSPTIPATAMTLNWEDAALTLFGDDQAGLKELRRWLRQFPDIDWPEGWFASRDPDDVRLLRVLRAMHPTHPPDLPRLQHRGEHASRNRRRGVRRPR